jgi:hypothetical protein
MVLVPAFVQNSASALPATPPGSFAFAVSTGGVPPSSTVLPNDAHAIALCPTEAQHTPLAFTVIAFPAPGAISWGCPPANARRMSPAFAK